MENYRGAAKAGHRGVVLGMRASLGDRAARNGRAAIPNLKFRVDPYCDVHKAQDGRDFRKPHLRPRNIQVNANRTGGSAGGDCTDMAIRSHPVELGRGRCGPQSLSAPTPWQCPGMPLYLFGMAAG